MEMISQNDLGAPKIAVVVGTYRRPMEAKATLRALLEMRDQGKIDRIILSTWYGEVDKMPGLRGIIPKLNLTLVESAPPRGGNSQNIFVQKKALRAGLERCPPGSHILKCRTDRTLIYLRKMLAETDDQRHPTAAYGKWPPVFSGKVRAHNTALNNVFHINDLIFSGMKEDMEKLCGYDLSYDEDFHPIINSEKRWFAGPFLSSHPIFRDYFTFFDSQAVANWIALLAIENGLDIIPQAIIRVLATYYILLHQNFTILGSGTEDETPAKDISDLFAARETSDSRTFCLSIASPSPALPPSISSHCILIKHGNPVARLLAGDFRNSSFGAKIYESAQSLSQQEPWTVRLDPPDIIDILNTYPHLGKLPEGFVPNSPVEISALDEEPKDILALTEEEKKYYLISQEQFDEAIEIISRKKYFSNSSLSWSLDDVFLMIAKAHLQVGSPEHRAAGLRILQELGARNHPDSLLYIAQRIPEENERMNWFLKAAEYGMHEAARTCHQGLASRLGPEAVAAWAEIVKRTDVKSLS